MAVLGFNKSRNEKNTWEYYAIGGGGGDLFWGLMVGNVFKYEGQGEQGGRMDSKLI